MVEIADPLTFASTGAELQRAFDRITAIREEVSKLGVAW